MKLFFDTVSALPDAEVLIWHDRPVVFDQLLAAIKAEVATLERDGIHAGDVVILEAEFSPIGLATLLALFELSAIVVPLTPASAATSDAIREISQANFECKVGRDESLTVRPLERKREHALYRQLRVIGSPGLVIFTSGSTGAPKGVVHDVQRLLSKFAQRRQCFRSIAFLLFDHIGGLDTLFYSLAGGSCLIVPTDRSPEAVCAAVAKHRGEVLPVSPSFLNLLLLSEAQRRHDLSTLRFITYGAEVMPESLLKRCAQEFPGVKLVQRYGTSELGALRSHSRGSDSVWLKLSGEGVQMRVVDGVLQLKSDTAMLGYLNAPSPFTSDGWLNTGDLVEQDGEFIRVVGRKSDIINVGGEKVFPAEVEAVIAEMPEVVEVCVTGEASSIMGKIVTARVRLKVPEDPRLFARKLKQFCGTRLEPFKVPVRVSVVDTTLHNERQKLLRQNG